MDNYLKICVHFNLLPDQITTTKKQNNKNKNISLAKKEVKKKLD